MKIESEEKRKRLIDMITRWCEHTKVLPQLRSYDIPGLVSQVLEEFYNVVLCCGHLIKGSEEGVYISFKDWYDGEECERSGVYCKECAEKYKKELGAWEVTK